MRARHLLDAVVEDDEVADRDRAVGPSRTSQPSGRSSSAPAVSGELALRPPSTRRRTPPWWSPCRSAPLGITAREKELHGREEALVEDLLLIGDELAHAIGDVHRAALELDHADREAVEVEDKIRAALVGRPAGSPPRRGKVVGLRVLPIHQVHPVVGLAGRELHRDTVPQQLVGAQVGLIEGDALRVGRGQQLLQGGGNVRVGVAALPSDWPAAVPPRCNGCSPAWCQSPRYRSRDNRDRALSVNRAMTRFCVLAFGAGCSGILVFP
jgi:hypothetical protein